RRAGRGVARSYRRARPAAPGSWSGSRTRSRSRARGPGAAPRAPRSSTPQSAVGKSSARSRSATARLRRLRSRGAEGGTIRAAPTPWRRAPGSRGYRAPRAGSRPCGAAGAASQAPPGPDRPEQQPPDLLIFSIGAKEAGLAEAVRDLATAARFGGAPVIVLVADGGADAVADALQAGALDAMASPVHFGEMRARIDADLRLRHDLSEAQDALR